MDTVAMLRLMLWKDEHKTKVELVYLSYNSIEKAKADADRWKKDLLTVTVELMIIDSVTEIK